MAKKQEKNKYSIRVVLMNGIMSRNEQQTCDLLMKMNLNRMKTIIFTIY